MFIRFSDQTDEKKHKASYVIVGLFYSGRRCYANRNPTQRTNNILPVPFLVQKGGARAKANNNNKFNFFSLCSYEIIRLCLRWFRLNFKSQHKLNIIETWWIFNKSDGFAEQILPLRGSTLQVVFHTNTFVTFVTRVGAQLY